MSVEKKVCLITFGCQMNEYDTGRLAGLLAGRGWVTTDSRAEADLIFFNTCSIRAKAARRVMNHLEQVRHLKKKKPGLIIAVGGCVAEQEGQALLAAAPWVDLVVGPQRLPELPALLETIAAEPYRGVLTGAGGLAAWSRENLSELGRGARAEAGAGRTGAAVSGFVTIMQGCDNYCAYCVVPFLRGPELSREADDVLDEIKRLIEKGARDVTLLGQNVNSYGRGLKRPVSFPELLEKTAALGLERLRFTTSHPKDFPPELVALFGSLGPLCESLHLPVQSGSDAVLTAMGRGYSRSDYLRLAADLRRTCPDLALTTDVIVGFPGETEADFEATAGLLETVGFDAIFSFKYSDRPRTRAAALPGKIPEDEKSRRLTHLQNLQKKITLAKNSAHLGQIFEVLVEKPSARHQGQLTGRARNFKLVHFDGPENLVGRLAQVRLTEAFGASLRGVLAPPPTSHI